MINIDAANWMDAWVKVHKLYAEQPDQTIDHRFATRAVSFENTINIASNDLGGLTHHLVGYTNYKLKLFDRNYIIPGMKEKIGAKLVERLKADKKLTVISYPFNILNEAHDQGPCVINISIVLMKVGRTWSVSYRINMRIGEITKRLLVDFIKFQELIDYWNGLLSEYNVVHSETTFYSTALYGQSLFIVITEHLNLGIKFNSNHWFHTTVQKQYEKFENPNFKMKMGNRVRKHVNRLRGIQHE